MKDEFFIGKDKYISSKRASKLTGYTSDYIGQLTRAGKVDGKLVGRVKFVNEGGIIKYKQNSILLKKEEAVERSVKYKMGRKVPLLVSNPIIESNEDVKVGYDTGTTKSVPLKENKIYAHHIDENIEKEEKKEEVVNIPDIILNKILYPYTSKVYNVLKNVLTPTIIKRGAVVAMLPFFIVGIYPLASSFYTSYVKNKVESLSLLEYGSINKLTEIYIYKMNSVSVGLSEYPKDLKNWNSKMSDSIVASVAYSGSQIKETAGATKNSITESIEDFNLSVLNEVGIFSEYFKNIRMESIVAINKTTISKTIYVFRIISNPYYSLADEIGDTLETMGNGYVNAVNSIPVWYTKAVTSYIALLNSYVDEIALVYGDYVNSVSDATKITATTFNKVKTKIESNYKAVPSLV
ncbi:MAG TPA: hypothetical protein ENI66_00835, partial [Candidatus Yonathbacteria bacterium]|nr:hypothetical protein [Candidatus Yonathbacteria bacterium]